MVLLAELAQINRILFPIGVHNSEISNPEELMLAELNTVKTV